MKFSQKKEVISNKNMKLVKDVVISVEEKFSAHFLQKNHCQAKTFVLVSIGANIEKI
jgi:hypothetical protein